jgi:glycine/D-amino acid oxidase-like deaminating enzyme
MAPPTHAEILVLGAGLQGACVALALAAQGHHPVVVDRARAPMTGASSNNEGKIHLGFVYALDATLETQRTMVRGAVAFAPLLDRWLGSQRWHEWRTERIHYAVMPGSLLPADELARRFEGMVATNDDIAESVADAIAAPAHYLGDPLTGAVDRERGAPGTPLVDGAPVESFLTEERAIDPERLARTVSRALREHPSITLLLGTEIVDADRTPGGFDVAVSDGDEMQTIRATQVVNCLWDQRIPVDACVGIESPVKSWTYRVKHQVVVRPRPNARVAPVTMVQGPFGDVVPRDDGRVCLSWYPVCRTQLEPGPLVRLPPDVDVLCRDTISAMTALFPSLEGADAIEVRGGTIMAPGVGDIDERASALHVRTNAAVHEHDGWWSIDTSKLTLAPLLAHEAARRVALRA